MEDFISKIAIFDSKSKNFKLKLEAIEQANVDIFKFFNDSTQASDYYSNLTSSKEEHDWTLATKINETEVRESVLTSVFYNTSNLVLLIIFNQEFCSKNLNLLRSSLRLFYEYLKIKNEEIKQTLL